MKGNLTAHIITLILSLAVGIGLGILDTILFVVYAIADGLSEGNANKEVFFIVILFFIIIILCLISVILSIIGIIFISKKKTNGFKVLGILEICTLIGVVSGSLLIVTNKKIANNSNS